MECAMSHQTPTKAFASQADLQEKKVSFTKLSEHAYAYTAEGDPNTGIVIGDDAVMVIDTQATPVMAQDVIRRIREVTDKPIKYVVLSHYHAVRVLGASAYGAEHIIASEDTLDMIKERGEQDKASEIGRFPRLFRNVESGAAGHDLADADLHRQDDAVAGQAGGADPAGGPWPHQGRHHRLAAGRAHPVQRRPGRVRRHALRRRRLLHRLAADAGQPGRDEAGPAGARPRRRAADRGQVAAGLQGTRDFIADVFAAVKAGAAAGKDLKTVYKDTMAAVRPKYGHWVIFDHCMPFDVTRAYDEATQYRDPRIWTAERDIEMWKQLET
jgi:hypothetical protein